MDSGDFFVGGYYGGASAVDFSPENRMSVEQKLGENFTVEDLLDFSNEEAVVGDGFFDNVAGNSTDSSTVTYNSPVSRGGNHFSEANFTHSSQFSGELFVPYDDLAELEWLSNFVDDSFSTDPAPYLRAPSTRFFSMGLRFRGKARSKRPQVAPCNWSTRVLPLNPKLTCQNKRENTKPNSESSSGRKCLHCASDKTPQWRTGPMGPKTLCNACGVRYKSGRLVPEYRPAASPTFISTKHSNSHRKVLELRRQNEMQRAQQHQHVLGQTSVFGISNGGDGVDDFLIHHHGGPRF